jgi:hypothetical protein
VGEPHPDHEYAIGFDAAFGIPGRDCDAAVVFDKMSHPTRQVAEVQGWIGERWDRVMYALCCYYNEAFIVGERQGGGISTLNRLWREYRYRWIYYNRKQQAVIGKPGAQIQLGHHRVQDDVTLRDFRAAVMQQAVELRSPALIEQMSRTEFREPRSQQSDFERREDTALKVKLAGGGSPDLVMAAVYGWLGVQTMMTFAKPKPAYDPDTLGAILGHDEFEERGDYAEDDSYWGGRR